MDEQQLIISSSPHVESQETVASIMYTVIIALVPAMLCAVLFFGLRAVILLLTCVASCVLTEYIFQKARRKPITVNDGSAIITGILLALVLPPTLSPLSAVLGSVVAIGLGKQVFGGLGFNIFNPALVGRAFLQATYPVAMTTWVAPFFYRMTDAVSAATPLSLMKFEAPAVFLEFLNAHPGLMAPLAILKFETQTIPYWKLFIGYTGGSLGETSAIALLIGGVILLCKKCINWRIPLGYFGTVAVISTSFWLAGYGKYPASPLFHLLSGGLMLGAIFMATDMVTSPITSFGCWIFGIGAGVLVMLIRLAGGLPEGVMYSILIMNAITPLINRYTRPKVFGSRKGGAAA